MTISELIKKLEALREEHGDVPVKTQTLSHLWDPEPEIRDKYVMPGGKQRDGWVLLNP